jgi:hypothetical protein
MNDATDQGADEAPEGAAVFPLIPEELGVHPLFLAMLHAYVFFEGSDQEVVDDDAAAEAMEYVATYLQRLAGRDLQRAREDLETLVGYAKEQEWPKQQVRFLQTFLEECGVAG